MKKDSTLGELYLRSLEIQSFKKNYPTISIMLASRLGEFEKRNSIYLNKLDRGVEKLFEDNVVKGDGGNFQYEVENERPTDKPKYYSEEHGKTFEEGWKALMESPCQLTI